MALIAADMENVYLVAGARTPFLKSGTGYLDLMAYQLGAAAIRAVLEKSGVPASAIERVILGNVLQDVRTSNVAREAALEAGIPFTTPCQTVVQACISANQAITTGMNQIRTGEARVLIAGGVDTASDPPILFPRSMRRKLLLSQRIKTAGDRLKFLLSMRFADFVPQRPAIAEFLTGRVMGEDCELLAGKFNISREAQDAFAARSHAQAASAWEAGRYGQVAPVTLPGGEIIREDNGIRPDTTTQKLARLKPAFAQNGTLTAGNSSFLTDGAAVVLLASESWVQENNLQPLARVVDYAYSGQSPWEELLLGPAYAACRLLLKHNLKLDSLDVIEFHEAFAGQVLANIAALESADFSQKHFGTTEPRGPMPMEKLNLWGGSLALGHPFGATGARIALTAVERLHAENGKLALLAACAAGGHGHAMLLEKV